MLYQKLLNLETTKVDLGNVYHIEHVSPPISVLFMLILNEKYSHVIRQTSNIEIEPYRGHFSSMYRHRIVEYHSMFTQLCRGQNCFVPHSTPTLAWHGMSRRSTTPKGTTQGLRVGWFIGEARHYLGGELSQPAG